MTIPKIQKTKLISEIFVWNILINIFIRVLNINQILEFMSPQKAKVGESEEFMKRIIGYVDFIQNHCNKIIKKTCLKRSLLLYYFLRKYSYDVEIHIGVRKTEFNLVAGHSWLTYNGKIYADSKETTNKFALIFTYPN